MATKTKARTSRKKAAAGPKPKHVTIGPEQRIHIHVVKGTKELSEYIAGADPEGVVRMNPAPEAPPPVADPDPISGT